MNTVAREAYRSDLTDQQWEVLEPLAAEEHGVRLLRTVA